MSDPRIKLLNDLRQPAPTVPKPRLVARPFSTVLVKFPDGQVACGNSMDFIHNHGWGDVVFWLPSPMRTKVNGSWLVAV